jgi:hypothetical protein
MAVRPIIVCGIDGTGKTPLIDMVVKAWNDPDSPDGPEMIVHRPPMAVNPTKWEPIDCFEYVIESMYLWKNNRGIWIYDRFPFPDELVYGTREYMKGFAVVMGDILDRAGVKVVYLEPKDADAFMRRKRLDQDPFFAVHTDAVYDGIITRYEEVLRASKLTTLRIEVGDEPLGDKEVVKVNNFIARYW